MFRYCNVVLLTKMERIWWIKQTLFSAFASDHHLSQSFEALDTKADIHCDGSVDGKYIIMAYSCIVKVVFLG